MRVLNLRILLFLICSLSSLGIAQESLWGNKKSGFILSYRLEDDRPTAYQLHYEQEIQMSMGGSPMNADKVFEVGYSLKSLDKTDNDRVRLIATLDTVTASMAMSMGKQSYDTRHLIGKTFEMHLHPKGREIKMSAPDSVPQLDLGAMAGGPIGIDEFIRYGFPVLPGQQVKKGFKWNAAFERTQSEGSIHVKAGINAAHRLAGYTTVDGIPCLKVESRFKGDLEGSELLMGSTWSYKGQLKGKATWFFSYEKGVLVKWESEETTEGTASTEGQNPMSVPVIQITAVKIGLRR